MLEHIIELEEKPEHIRKIYGVQYLGPSMFASFANFMAGQEIALDNSGNIVWYPEKEKQVVTEKGGWVIKRGVGYEAYSNKAIEKYFTRIL